MLSYKLNGKVSLRCLEISTINQRSLFIAIIINMKTSAFNTFLMMDN